MKITITRFDSVTSTQDEARRMAEAGAPEGSVAVAKSQSSGRGRLGRAWQSPPGGLWFSVILRPSIPSGRAAGLTIMAAVSIADAVRQVTGVKTGIKWPNDILVGDRKLAGILTEMKARGGAVDYVIMGIGINANVAADAIDSDSAFPPTSILRETGRTVDMDILLDACLARLGRDYRGFRDGFEEIRQRWIGLNAAAGRRVMVAQPAGEITGRVVGLDETGALVLELDGGDTRVVTAGDLRFLQD